MPVLANRPGGGAPLGPRAPAATATSNCDPAVAVADAVPSRELAQTLRRLASADFATWQLAIQTTWGSGDAVGAETLAAAALAAHPNDSGAVLEYAAVLRARGQGGTADAALRQHATLPLVALELAAGLREQGRFEEACGLVSRALGDAGIDAQTCWRGCQFLEESGRPGLALACCEARIAAGGAAAEELANAARLAMQLGRFELARDRYQQALAAGLDPIAWKVSEALATCQRYTSAQHPDAAQFKRWLTRPGLTGVERAGPLFALGKLHDDVGAYREAAECWKQANAELAVALPWNREVWTRTLAAVVEPWAATARPAPDWVPVFVVGMPRSGTTLVARLLADRPAVRNRGELMWIPQLSDQILARGERKDATALAQAANGYARMLVQDDAPAHWYLDKQNFNFLQLGLIAALFPCGHVIYCVRDPRDTALSIWSQHVGGGAATAFMYAFDHIAQVTDGCRQLMMYWQAHLGLPIHTVVYEELVQAPGRVLADLRGALGIPALPRPDIAGAAATPDADVVATASMWQARQPVSTRSVGRWRHYARYVPALTTLFDGGAG